MKAIQIIQAGEIKVVDIDTPEIQPDEVLIKSNMLVFAVLT
jgi:NADPH:quinone reductase-like Zn-dependent oxidoreductase